MKGPLYAVASNGCWVWTRARMTSGYGVIRRERRNRPAHRWFYEQKYGPVASGLELDHLCRNRACVNPDHLEPVTHAENGRRGSRAKITMDIAREIRRLHGSGVQQRALAERFGLAASTVSNIIRGARWAEEVMQ